MGYCFSSYASKMQEVNNLFQDGDRATDYFRARESPVIFVCHVLTLTAWHEFCSPWCI